MRTPTMVDNNAARLRARKGKTMRKKVKRRQPPKQPDLLCLDASELKAFEAARRYVNDMCGPSSDGDVIRFLIRDWDPK
jgi:hypothetical protein